MKLRKLLAIGGCHVTGFGINGSKSFVSVFSENAGYESENVIGYFQLKKVHQLTNLVHESSSNYILLQLGNHEFNASLKKLLKISPISSSKSASKTKAAVQKLCAEKDSFLKRVFYFLTVPLVYRISIFKHRSYLNQLKTIIRQNPSKTFIILSPFPSLKQEVNYVRNKAGKKMAGYFSPLPNTIFIDLFQTPLINENNFLDAFHLNPVGHKHLAHIMEQQLAKRAPKCTFIPQQPTYSLA